MAARKYKGHFLFYLYRALGSSDETQVHLSLLHGTGSLKDETLYGELSQSYAEVSRMLFAFIQSVERRHERPHYLKGKAGEPDLPVADDPDPPF